MAKRNVMKKTYLTESEAAQLSRWSEETGKSESHLLREAILEYLDHDRGARIEERLDRIEEELSTLTHTLDSDSSHTHTAQTPMNQGSKATERAREIVRRLQQNNDVVVKTESVVRAIEDIAGADERTVRKYKGLFRRRGLLFEHPGDPPLWAIETDQWSSWIQDYLRLNGREATEDVLEDYPAVVTEGANGLQIELNSDEIEAPN